MGVVVQNCKVCTADNTEELEALGLLAVNAEISWRETARRLEWTHHGSLKTHMEKHYKAPDSPVDKHLAEGNYEQMVAATLLDLEAQMRHAPVELKPLYAVVIRNLIGLDETKPSQQHLVQAIKAIHEVTGMKMEQRLMVEFAQHAFGEMSAAPSPPAIEATARAIGGVTGE